MYKLIFIHVHIVRPISRERSTLSILTTVRFALLGSAVCRPSDVMWCVMTQEQSSSLFTLGVVSYCVGLALVCERLNLSHEVNKYLGLPTHTASLFFV